MNLSFKTLAAGVSRTVTRGAKGGNSGNTVYTGNLGGYVKHNGATILRYLTGGCAKVPGGGANGNTDARVAYYGAPGETGMIIVHY